MGSRQRQIRERDAVRRAILDAARTLFVEQGYRNVSIRRVAQRIEYSAAAIYSYFPSKDAIFHTLAGEGFQLLNERLDQTAAEGADPLDQLRRGFHQYYEFSTTHPEYFGLMFLDRTVPRISEDWDRFGFVHSAFDKAAAGIRRCIEAGYFPPTTDPHVVFHILWTAVHGAAVIGLSNLMAPGEDPEALARDTFEAALNGIRHGITTTFVGADYQALCRSCASAAGVTDAQP